MTYPLIAEQPMIGKSCGCGVVVGVNEKCPEIGFCWDETPHEAKGSLRNYMPFIALGIPVAAGLMTGKVSTALYVGVGVAAIFAYAISHID